MLRRSFISLLFDSFAVLLVALGMMGMLTACGDEDDGAATEEPAEVESITLGVTNMAFGSAGGTQTVYVSSSGSWYVEGSNWLTVNPSSGTGSRVVEVVADSNSYKGSADRTGSLKFALDSGEDDAHILVTQLHDDCITKILAIGNSFTEDCVEQYLWELFDAAGMEAVVANLRIGSSCLEDHYNNAVGDYPAYSYRKVVDGEKTVRENTTMLYGVQDEDWDYICFHQRTVLVPSYDDYFPYLPYLMEYVTENSTNEEMEIAFHMPWAHRDGSGTWNCSQLAMYNLIIDMVQRIVTELGIGIVAPTGTAIQNARNSWFGNTLNRDDEHLDYDYGRYTAACTWFEEFSGVDVTTTTYAPDTVTDAQKDVCVHAAHFAVQSPYELNSMTDWKVTP